MKALFVKGLLAFFSIGIIGFLGKIILVDFLAEIFRPAILIVLTEVWVIPLTIVLTIIIIFLMGLILSIPLIRTVLSWILKRIFKKIDNGEGVLIKTSEGLEYLAIFIKEIKFKRLTGVIENRCILFAPYSPIPGTGLPLIFAKSEMVTHLTMSYKDLYGTISSFGKNAPDLIEERER